MTFRSLVLGTAAIGLVGAGVSSANAAETEKKLTVSGFVNRVLAVTDDGDASYVDFSDNAADNSRFRMTGTSTGGGLTIGAEIEFGLTTNQNQNQSSQSANTPEGSTNGLLHRKAYVWVESEKWGVLTLGLATTASDGIAEVDLSGTEAAAYNGSWGPSTDYYFLQSGQKGGQDSSATGNINAAGADNPQINSVFDNFSGDSRRDLIRYDTPDIKGFSLGVSASEGGAVDGAINYSGKFYNTEVAAAVGALNAEGRGEDLMYAASVSALHASGLNATFSWGKNGAAGQEDAQNLYVKLGYQMKLTNLGPTNVSISWQRATDIASEQDSATALGLQLVQGLEDYGTELYAAYSNFELNRDGTSYQDIDAGWVGAIVKF